MKRSLLVILVAVLAMPSCKKDYTCECATTSNDPDWVSSKATSTVEAKKKDAEATCNVGDKTYSIPDPISGETYTYKTECSLK